ncbi:DsbA family protein [Bacteroidota bacterium]
MRNYEKISLLILFTILSILIIIVLIKLVSLEKKIEYLGGITTNYVLEKQYNIYTVDYLPSDEFVLGDEGVSIIMAIIFNYNCPHCRDFFIEIFPQLQEEYISKGLVRLAFIEHPNPNLPELFLSSEAALCARDQDKYLEFVLHMMQASQTISKDDIISVAAKVDLDLELFHLCLENGETKGRLLELLDIAEDLGVKGTPSLIIGDKLYLGSRSYTEIKNIIDKQLKR